jgi:hypothetical protein
MTKLSTCAIALALSLGASTAFATADLPANQTTAGQTAANQDFGKLSRDGSMAIRDVRLARLAIFDGQPDKAKTYIDEAQTAINKAKTDDTIFTKAEADLKAPAGVSQPGPANSTPNTTPIKWIPVDGSMTVGEDYVATPEKSAGIAKANAQLKTGNSKQAMETLKLADINVSYVLEVAPADKTASGINQAAQLIGAGKYYEANQALKSVEDGLRIDVTDVNAVPKKGTAGATASNSSSTGTSNTQPTVTK